jgi:peroxiredoxin
MVVDELMQRVLIFFSFLLFSFPALAVEKGEKAPEFSVTTASGEPLHLSQFSGRVVLLDFWASWCGSCSESLQWLDGLQRQFEREDFQVIAVNLDQDRKDAEQLLQKLQLDLLIGFDGAGASAELYQLSAMPSSYLIDKDGTVISLYTGVKEKDKKEVEQRLQKLLKD